MKCKVAECDRFVKYKGYCSMHYQRIRRNGHTDRVIREKGAGNINDRYHRITINGKSKRQHVRVAESVLGKPLPKGAVVHHWDGNGLNNTPSNLLICPNQAYHQLIHTRTEALKASGHAHYRKCNRCHEYDDPENMLGPYKRDSSDFNHKMVNRKCGNIDRTPR